MRSELIVTPDAEAITILNASWSWLLPDEYRPLLFTAMGDMFYEDETGEVFWLNTSAGDIEMVAANAAEFEELLETEAAEDWLLPELVDAVVATGKVRLPGQVYGYHTLPVFPSGDYVPENIVVVAAKDVYRITGHIHRKMCGLGDDETVRLVPNE
jgi:hypothetical protein